MLPDRASPSTLRISRETRRLLIAAVLALVTLWVLARIRFPDRPVSANPVPPVLTQLVQSARFSDLASEIIAVRNRLAGGVVAVPLPQAGGDARMAVRVMDGVAVTLASPARAPEPDVTEFLALDPASRLALIRVPVDTNSFVPDESALDLSQPGYVFATVSPFLEMPSLLPAFLWALKPTTDPAWTGTVWAVPREANLKAGMFLFASDGTLVGLVAAGDGDLIIVPSQTLRADADRLIATPTMGGGSLGIDVQPLTPELATLAGTAEGRGVMVAWVDPKGPLAQTITVGDVIESMNGRVVETIRWWNVHVARIAPEEKVTLRVVRAGAARELSVKGARAPYASPPAAADPVSTALGMSMRIEDEGARLLRVEGGSAAARAGLESGDLITVFGAIAQPTPEEVQAHFAAVAPGRTILVAVTRGDTHLLVTVAK